EQALAHSRRTESSLFVDEWRVGFLEGEPPLLDEALGVLLRQQPGPTVHRVRRWLELTANSARTSARLRPPAVDDDVRRRAADLRQQLEACYARLWNRRVAGVRRAEPGRMRALERRALELEGRLRRLASDANPQPDLPAPEREGTPPPGTLELRYFCAAGMLG